MAIVFLCALAFSSTFSMTATASDPIPGIDIIINNDPGPNGIAVPADPIDESSRIDIVTTLTYRGFPEGGVPSFSYMPAPGVAFSCSNVLSRNWTCRPEDEGFRINMTTSVSGNGEVSYSYFIQVPGVDRLPQLARGLQDCITGQIVLGAVIGEPEDTSNSTACTTITAEEQRASPGVTSATFQGFAVRAMGGGLLNIDETGLAISVPGSGNADGATIVAQKPGSNAPTDVEIDLVAPIESRNNARSNRTDVSFANPGTGGGTVQIDYLQNQVFVIGDFDEVPSPVESRNNARSNRTDVSLAEGVPVPMGGPGDYTGNIRAKWSTIRSGLKFKIELELTPAMQQRLGREVDFVEYTVENPSLANLSGFSEIDLTIQAAAPISIPIRRIVASGGSERLPLPPRLRLDVGAIATAFDANNNDLIDDGEIRLMLQSWIKGEEIEGTDGLVIADEDIEQLMTTWILGEAISEQSAAPAQAAIEPLRLDGSAMLPHANGYSLSVHGQGILQTTLRVYDLSGRTVLKQVSPGNQLSFATLTAEGQRWANGVYLYVISAQGIAGEVQRSVVKKFVVMN